MEYENLLWWSGQYLIFQEDFDTIVYFIIIITSA